MFLIFVNPQEERTLRTSVENLRQKLEAPGEEYSLRERVEILGELGYALLGLVETDSKHLDEALSVFEESVQVFQTLGDKRGDAAGRATIGLILHQMGDYGASTEFYIEAVQLFEQLSDSLTEILECIKGIGLNLIKLGDFVGAITQFQHGTELARENGDTGSLLDFYANLIFLHEKFDHWEEMVTIYKDVVNLFEDLDDPVGMVSVYINLAALFIKLNKATPAKYPKGKESARVSLKRALAIARKCKENRLIAKIHEKMAEIALVDRDLETVKRHYRYAKEIYASLDATEDERRLDLALRLLEKSGGNHGD